MCVCVCVCVCLCVAVTVSVVFMICPTLIMCVFVYVCIQGCNELEHGVTNLNTKPLFPILEFALLQSFAFHHAPRVCQTLSPSKSILWSG